MQQTYETIFILQPELTEEEMESTVGIFEGLLKERKADLHKTENWGKKRLAYRVRKFWEGFYVFLEYTSDSDSVNELERRLRIHDDVIKWMSVRKDPRAAAEEERRAARMAKAAAQRAEGGGNGDSPSSGRGEGKTSQGPEARKAQGAAEADRKPKSPPEDKSKADAPAAKTAKEPPADAESGKAPAGSSEGAQQGEKEESKS